MLKGRSVFVGPAQTSDLMFYWVQQGLSHTCQVSFHAFLPLILISLARPHGFLKYKIEISYGRPAVTDSSGCWFRSPVLADHPW